MLVAVGEQKQLMVNISSMLEDELGWLTNFVPSEHPDNRDTDNILLAAHLRLIRTLLTCEGVNKQDAGIRQGSASMWLDVQLHENIFKFLPDFRYFATGKIPEIR